MNITTQFYLSDIHSHIVPYVDDGAEDMDMALQMIEMEYKQGVRMLVCSSHNGYSRSYINNYLYNFQKLKDQIRILYPDMKLISANEIYCTKEDMDEIIYLLSTGDIIPINTSKYVLIEFNTYVSIINAEYIVNSLLCNGWIPVIAHFERYKYLYDEDFINRIVQKGVLIQTNLFSYAEEPDSEIKNRAHKLLENSFVHFVGSDSHSSTRRAPSLTTGAEYIISNTSVKYARQLLHDNAVRLFSKEDNHGNS